MTTHHTIGQFKRQGRVFVALDLENLMRGTRYDVDSLRAAWMHVVETCSIPSDAHVVVGASCVATLFAAKDLLGQSGRTSLLRGKDGADLTLIDTLLNEDIAVRFERVIIVSGDGAFTFAAQHLYGLDVTVTVASGESALSNSLRRCVTDVRLLDLPNSSEGAA